MRIRLLLASALLLPCIAVGQPLPTSARETVVVPSGSLRLKAFLWKPAPYLYSSSSELWICGQRFLSVVHISTAHGLRGGRLEVQSRRCLVVECLMRALGVVEREIVT
jgi:hypothetical protein